MKAFLLVPLSIVIVVVVVVVVGMGVLHGSAHAAVYHSKESALKAAFPHATRVEQRNVFLTPKDRDRIHRNAGSAWNGGLASVHVGYRDAVPVGYAFIDTHQVRSMNETVMVVISPKGALRQVLLLAFHEPPEYQVPPRWLTGLKGRRLDASLGVGRGVDGVTGATLSAHAMVAAVRRVLTLYEIRIASEG